MFLQQKSSQPHESSRIPVRLQIKQFISVSVRRIHRCHGPVGDADGQKEEGDDRVEESGHDVANGPRNSKDQTLYE